MTQNEINTLMDNYNLDFKSLLEVIDGELYFSKNSCLYNFCCHKLVLDEYSLGGVILIYSRSYESQERSNESVLLLLQEKSEVYKVTFIDNEFLKGALTDEVLSELHMMGLLVNLVNGIDTTQIDALSAHRRITIQNIAK